MEKMNLSSEEKRDLIAIGAAQKIVDEINEKIMTVLAGIELETAKEDGSASPEFDDYDAEMMIKEVLQDGILEALRKHWKEED